MKRASLNFYRKVFAGTGVQIEVVQGQKNFEREYPCLAAVNRAASGQERHDGRVIWITYQPEGKIWFQLGKFTHRVGCVSHGG